MKEILESHPVKNLKDILKKMKQEIGSYSKMKKAELVSRIIELKKKGFPVPKVEMYKKPVSKKPEPKPKPVSKKPEPKPKPVSKKPEPKKAETKKKEEPKKNLLAYEKAWAVGNANDSQKVLIAKMTDKRKKEVLKQFKEDVKKIVSKNAEPKKEKKFKGVSPEPSKESKEIEKERSRVFDLLEKYPSLKKAARRGLQSKNEVYTSLIFDAKTIKSLKEVERLIERAGKKELKAEPKKAEPKPKPETKKPEPKKPPAKPKIELKEVKGDIDYEDLFNELGKGFQSRRNIENFKKKFGKDFFTTTLNARLGRDFYSTPPKCILENDIITKSLRGSSDIFEPTAGLGALVYSALRAGASKQNITANDIVPEFADFIKKNFKVKTTNNDFLKTDYKNNTFDTILINPPFSFAGNKRFYMDFFYKGLSVLEQSKAKGLKQMFFISPPMGEEKNGMLLEENFNINNKKKIELYKKYGLEDDIIDGEPESVATQINVIGKCKDFGGTGITADIYEVLV